MKNLVFHSVGFCATLKLVSSYLLSLVSYCAGNLPNIGHHRPPSPHGRRDELIRQKRALEEEQAHLQRLLEEQENLLRLRQRELTVSSGAFFKR